MTDAEIVKALAEKVMGWQPQSYWVDERGNTWNPLKDSNHSDQIVDKLSAQGWYFEYYQDSRGACRARFCQLWFPGIVCIGETRHHTIAEAVLRTIGEWKG